MRRTTPTLVLSLCAYASAAGAQVPVELHARGDARLVIDGVLRDWSTFGDMHAVDERGRVASGLAAWQGPDDASFAFTLAHDAQALYLAAEVRDDRVVRSRAHRAPDDTLVLTFAAGASVTEIELQPGEPGAFAAVARVVGRGNLAGATVVEAPLASGSGFTLEARLPWTSLPGVREAMSTLRARVAYRDADVAARPVVETVIATGPGDAQHAASIPMIVGAAAPVSPDDLLERFRRDHGCVGVAPLLNRPVDVGGDARTERAVVFPGFVVVYGPGVLDGASYSFLELPSHDATALVDPRAIDVTGDRHEEILLTWRTNEEAGLQRDVQLVYQVDDHGALHRIFAQELSRRRGDQSVTDRVTFQGSRIDVSAGEARGFTAATVPNVREAGVEEMLLPWGPVRARTWQWNPAQHAFAATHDEPNPSAQTAPAAVAPSLPAARGFDPEALLRLVRARENIAAGTAPDHSATGDVAEDPTPEQVVVFGRTMAVVGPRFLGGATFYSMSLPLNDSDRVLSLRLADVTGDGHADAVLRVQRQVTTQVQGAALVSRREMLLVYGIEAPVRRRLFAAEVARRVDGSSIENEVVMPAPGAAAIRIRPGAARGWTATTYPFHDSAPQGYFPLLLPWDRAQAEVTYRWNGTAFERSP